MDFSESNNSIWARTWLNGNQSSGSGMVSIDAGADWTVFGEMAQHPVSSGAAAWETWDVGAYLAQQKAKGNNTVTLVVCAGNSISPLWATGALAACRLAERDGRERTAHVEGAPSVLA